LTDIVSSYIKDNCLLLPDRPVIAGFSGGSDSTALLFLLNKLGYRCIAAHCNFHLRGEESNRDEMFAQRFAEQLNIEFEKLDFEAAKYAKTKRLSIEMAARELRYEWFEILRIKHNAQAIAVAHHKDDNAETLLLNLIRGAGIHGLCGMKPKNGFVIRPLLCVNKEQIVRFLDDNNINSVYDSTNSSEAYTRNRLRLKLIPLIKEINPSVIDTLNRTAQHLAETETLFNDAVERAAKNILLLDNDATLALSISELLKSKAPHTVLYELLKPYGFSGYVTDTIFRSLNKAGKTFFAIDKSYKLLTASTRLLVYPNEDATARDEEYLIESVDADLSLLPVALSICLKDVNDSFLPDKAATTATFDSDKVMFPLTLRRWRYGDRLVPFGMNGSKKLSDLFADNKLSIHDKQHLWLLCSNNNIIWAIGLRTDNRFRITKHTTKALIIKYF
jgi:tRNA(Ile)-lysidine synthase